MADSTKDPAASTPAVKDSTDTTTANTLPEQPTAPSTDSKSSKAETAVPAVVATPPTSGTAPATVEELQAQADAAAPAEDGPAKTTLKILTPFTDAFEVDLGGDMQNYTILAAGTEVPASDADEIIERAEGVGVVIVAGD